jgi:hypothetical protein
VQTGGRHSPTQDRWWPSQKTLSKDGGGGGVLETKNSRRGRSWGLALKQKQRYKVYMRSEDFMEKGRDTEILDRTGEIIEKEEVG